MKISNKEDWEKGLAANKDPYGAECFRYAEAWADLIEAEMLKGRTLESCAKETSRAADTEGITGFMYGMAVSILASCWVHGEELRRWHNMDLSPKQSAEANAEAGVVLNPAVVHIEIPEGDACCKERLG